MPRTPPTIEQPPAPDPAIFLSLDAFRGRCGEPSLPLEQCLVDDYDVDYGDDGYTNTVPLQVSQLEMFVNGPQSDSYQGEALLRCPTCHRLYYGKSETEHVGARTYSTTSYQRVGVDAIYRSPWCVGWRMPDRDIDAVHPESFLEGVMNVRVSEARRWLLLDDNNQLAELGDLGSESLQRAINSRNAIQW